MAQKKTTKSKKEKDFVSRQKQLNQDLAAGSFCRSYLIYGQQAYLRLQNRDKIKSTLLGDGDEMNLSYFSGSEFTVREIIELSETLPFFADRRVIVIENSTLFGKGKGEQNPEELAEYLPNIPETTSIIFVEEEVDRKRKLYKALQKNGYVLECDGLDSQSLVLWTAGIFKKSGLKITGQVMNEFLSRAGEDMFNIRGEAEKLSSYCFGSGEVRMEDVKAICSRQIQDRIFDMIDAIASKENERAMSIYMDLLHIQTPPQVILSLLVSQFNRLLKIQELGNLSDTEIGSLLNIRPYFIDRQYRPLIRKYRRGELRRALDLCLDADMAYKSGLVQDRIAVEMLIVKCTAGE